MLLLKQSTAVTVKIGPFVDSGDGNTDETGLTISQADVRLSKAGGDLAQKNNSTSCTHDELGIYDCPLSTTDTNTLGPLELFVHESGALPVWHKFMVVPADVYDALVGGTGNGVRASVQTMAAAVITSSVIATGAITAGGIAADAIGASELAADAATEIATAVAAAILATPANLLATDASGNVTLSTATKEAIADALLARAIAGGSNAGRLVKDALKFLRNKWTLSGGTLTVFEADDTTPAWTASVATSAGDPVSSVDPA